MDKVETLNFYWGLRLVKTFLFELLQHEKFLIIRGKRKAFIPKSFFCNETIESKVEDCFVWGK